MKTNESKRKSRVTIKDVAKASEVSIATVSYVLNNTPGQSISDETRKKVLQFANLLGYECNVMAKYLATGKTNSVAAVVKNIPPLAAPYYLQLLTELSRLLNRRNIDLKIVDYADGYSRNGSPCDAYITVALSEQEFRSFAETKYVPVLAIDSEFQDRLFYRINDDHKTLSETAKRDLGASDVTLLTFELPQENIDKLRACYSDVAVMHSLGDLATIDRNAHYATVSKLLYDNAPCRANIKLENASFALKASAALDAVIKAINRVQSSTDEHNITV